MVIRFMRMVNPARARLLPNPAQPIRPTLALAGASAAAQSVTRAAAFARFTVAGTAIAAAGPPAPLPVPVRGRRCSPGVAGLRASVLPLPPGPRPVLRPLIRDPTCGRG
jgi:hypothetical protein